MINKKAKQNAGGTIFLFILVMAGIYIYFAYFSSTNTNENRPIINQTNSNNNEVSYTVISNSNITYNILPNYTLTPGHRLTNNLTIICVSGYSATVRDVPQSLREEIFRRDNVPYPQPTGSTELDHIIPLCLGGSNDMTNLFVEFAEPRPGYKEKDKLENYLCDHVCSGEIDINYAQNRIAKDWYSYYKEIYG